MTLFSQLNALALLNPLFAGWFLNVVSHEFKFPRSGAHCSWVQHFWLLLLPQNSRRFWMVLKGSRKFQRIPGGSRKFQSPIPIFCVAHRQEDLRSQSTLGALIVS